MKIGLDAKRAFNNTSGLGNYSRNIIRALSEQTDLELFLYTPNIKEHIKASNAFFKRDNLKIIEPKDALNKTIKPYWRSFSIAKDVQKHHLDLYHGLSNEIPFTLGKMTKTIVSIHDLIFKRYPQWYKPFDRKMYDWKFKSACKNADKIIAISEQTKSDLVDFYQVCPDKISVIYQTCDDAFKTKAEEAFKQSVRQKYHLPETFLLNVGTIEPRKNAFDIVQALHQHRIDTPLVMVGRPTDYANQIRSYISKHGLERQILMLQGVSNEELPAIYQMAESFIYPSTFEGFGIPIIEALYSGVPVISSTGGCFSEAGGSDSLYVDSGNIEALANAIRQVLEDTNKRQEMIDKGLEYVRRFDKQVITQNLMDLYKEVIDK